MLCKTSNPGSGEFQNRRVVLEGDELTGALRQPTLGRNHVPTVCPYELVAYNVSTKWNVGQNCALVVGATYPEELVRVRAIVGRLPILVPGIGKQGGDLEAMLHAGFDDRGFGVIVNSSRGIIHATMDDNVDEVAGEKARELSDQIVDLRTRIMEERAAG